MSYNKGYSNKQFLEFFRSKLSAVSHESGMRYRKTLSELELFLVGHHIQFADLSEMMMADWATELLYRGLAVSTVTRHLNSLNSMVKDAAKEGMMELNNAPRSVAKSLSELSALPLLLDGSVFENTLSLLRSALKEHVDSKYNVFHDIVLFSMLNGALSLDKIAHLRKENLRDYDGYSLSILMRNVSNRRDYIFDLRQSMLTSRQLKSAISSGVFSAFKSGFEKSGFDPDEFVRSLWTACAIRSGLLASEALGYVGGSASYSIPGFCTPASVSADGKDAWISTVNAMLTSEMPKWYVMQMRRGVSYDELRKEICDKIRPCPVLYYPCETILKERGNKKVSEERPFISRTVFFRSYPENVMPMFSIIGDKAWCYRVLGVSGSPYAVIPQRDMERFQRAIGVFTSEVEIHPLNELLPKPGETVILIKAGFGNRPATVEDVIKNECGSAIFRVKFDTDNGYEFRIDVDARQLERIVG